jgi:hypothetical protein
MATLSFVDTNGVSITATVTYENNNTSLRLVKTMPNGKTKEVSKLYNDKLTIFDAVEKAGVVIDNFYPAEYSE